MSQSIGDVSTRLAVSSYSSIIIIILIITSILAATGTDHCIGNTITVHTASKNRSKNNTFHLFPFLTIHEKMTAQSLYRNLLRQAKQVTDYNFRTYSIRRVKAGFRKNQHLEGWVNFYSNRIMIWMSEMDHAEWKHCGASNLSSILATSDFNRFTMIHQSNKLLLFSHYVLWPLHMKLHVEYG